MTEFGIATDPAAIEDGARIIREAFSSTAQEIAAAADRFTAAVRAGWPSAADLGVTPPSQ